MLVGTISVEVSERVSGLLERKGIPHNVLNAKTGQEGQEAQIIKDAGTKGAVTIATNMAGRGVDIKLGEGVVDAGGLYVIGTERHESRRIDNQLRGRSGRQGDPGETRFFLSAEDQLVRLFAGDRIFTILDKLGPGRGSADRAQDAHEAHRGRPEARRGDALRHAQAGAQVRRRAQQAARGDLRRAPRRARGRRPARGDPRVDRRGRRGRRDGAQRVELPRGVGSRRALHRAQPGLPGLVRQGRASARSASSSARS